MSKINQRENYITTLVRTPKDRFKVLFDFAPVPLIEGIWTTSFQVINANQAALQLFLSPDRPQFDQWFPAFPTKIHAKVLLELLSARVKGDFFEHEVRLPTMRRGHIDVFMRVAYIPAALASAPQHVILSFQDITPFRKRENFLKKLAQLDGLTGVLNRKAILGRLDEELTRAKRYELHLSCALLDLDHLGKINNNFGHLVGDKCLCHAVDALRTTLRKTDIIGRFGADEFMLILPETRLENARIPIERFLQTPQAKEELINKNMRFKLGFSAGISAFPLPGINSMREMINAANQALSLAKDDGGNKIRLYEHAKVTLEN